MQVPLYFIYFNVHCTYLRTILFFFCKNRLARCPRTYLTWSKVDIKPNQTVHTFKEWGHFYRLEFKIRVDKISQEALNVFDFIASSGDSIVKLSVRDDFKIQSRNYGSSQVLYEIGKDHNFIIQQFEDSQDIWKYEIIKDGAVNRSRQIKIEETFDNVKFFAGNPTAQPFNSEHGRLWDIKIHESQLSFECRDQTKKTNYDSCSCKEYRVFYIDEEVPSDVDTILGEYEKVSMSQFQYYGATTFKEESKDLYLFSIHPQGRVWTIGQGLTIDSQPLARIDFEVYDINRCTHYRTCLLYTSPSPRD